MGHACLLVLQQTGLPDSPLYWEKHTDRRKAGPVNDYLVSLFEKLLEQAKTCAALPPAENLNQEVARKILELINAA